MPTLKLNNIGSVGVIKDIPAHELPPEAFSEAINVRFRLQKAELFEGHEDVFNITVSAATATQAIAESPWYVHPIEAGTVYYWLYAGKNNVHVATKESNSTNINKLDSTASATLLYSATPSIRWNGANLGGLAILNNGIDSPQVWTAVSLSTRLQDLQWDQSAGTTWATRSAGAVTCSVFRTYREFGVALDTIEGGTDYQRRVRWSHPTVSNVQPETWDESRQDKDAGFVDLDDTADPCMDGLQLRDTMIIYKRDYTWLMQWIGGQFVHSFREKFQFGGISHQCVAEFFGNHLVFTNDRDIVLHDGQNARSIIGNKLKLALANEVDTDYSGNSFVVEDYLNEEIWVCYPESGAPEPYWCTKALIWNWRFDTWQFRELPKASHIARGIIDFGGGSGDPLLIWDSISTSWDSQTITWGEQGFKTTEPSLLMARPFDSAGASDTPQLLKLNSGFTFDGSNISSLLERERLPFSGGSSGPHIDKQSIKYIKEVWPYIDAPPGTFFNIFIGSQQFLSDPVTYSGPFLFTVGTDQKINCRVVGRYISYKITCDCTVDWKLTDIDFIYDRVGRY